MHAGHIAGLRPGDRLAMSPAEHQALDEPRAEHVDGELVVSPPPELRHRQVAWRASSNGW